jgi:hypothetical protein
VNVTGHYQRHRTVTSLPPLPTRAPPRPRHPTSPSPRIRHRLTSTCASATHSRSSSATTANRQPPPPLLLLLPLFQLRYGFNVDWSTTNLETIFYWDLNPSAAAAAGVDQQWWGQDVNQYRLQQEAWQNGGKRGGSGGGSGGGGVPDTDERAAALELVLSRIDHRRSTTTDGASASSAVSALSSSTVPEGSASEGLPQTWVSHYEDYSVSGNFNAMSDRFAKGSDDEHWENKGVPKQREMRMLSHFMDPSRLIDGDGSADSAFNSTDGSNNKRKKLTKQELKLFKERKKARKRKAQLRLL